MLCSFDRSPTAELVGVIAIVAAVAFGCGDDGATSNPPTDSGDTGGDSSPIDAGEDGTDDTEPDTNEDVGADTTDQTAGLRGVVRDQFGQPLADVDVTLENTTTTSSDGRFSLSESPGNHVLALSRDGYAPYARKVTLTLGMTTSVEVVLVARQPSVVLDMSKGGTVTVGDVSVTLSSGSLVGDDGQAHMGTARIAVTGIDPTQGIVGVPGDFSGRVSGGDETKLAALGTAEFYFEGENGNRLRLGDGQTATIELPLMPTSDVLAAAQLPAWSFDETSATWIEEGSFEVVNEGFLVARGDVSHFSWWTAGPAVAPEDTGCVRGVATFACDATPAAGAQVTLRTNVGFAAIGSAGPDGSFCLQAPAGEPGNLRVVADDGSAALETAANTTVSMVSGMCATDGCQRVDLALPCETACGGLGEGQCEGCITTMLLDDQGQPLANVPVTFYSLDRTFRTTVRTQSDGAVCVSVPIAVDLEGSFEVPGYRRQRITTRTEVTGTCPTCDDLGPIMLQPLPAAEECFRDDRSIVLTNAMATDEDTSLAELGEVSAVVVETSPGGDLMFAFYAASSRASFLSSSPGSSYWFVEGPVPAMPGGGSSPVLGRGVQNVGGTQGIDATTVSTDGAPPGMLSWGPQPLTVGSRFVGTLQVVLRTHCGASDEMRLFEYDIDVPILDQSMLELTTECVVGGLESFDQTLPNVGRLSITIDGEEMTAVHPFQVASYLVDTNVFFDFQRPSDGLTFNADTIPALGEQTMNANLDVDGCVWSGSGLPSITIGPNESGDLSRGPTAGSFDVELPLVGGACEPTKRVTGTFDLAVCTL